MEKQFDILEGKTTGKTWVPWYNMHKMLTGLVDAYKYTGNKQALEVAKKLGDWFIIVLANGMPVHKVGFLVQSMAE